MSSTIFVTNIGSTIETHACNLEYVTLYYITILKDVVYNIHCNLQCDLRRPRGPRQGGAV